MNIKTNILYRIYMLSGILVICMFLIVGKIYQIQHYKHGYWKDLADSVNIKTYAVPAERGNIFSADDRLLATSLPFFNLHVDFGSSAMTDEIFEENVDSLAIMAAKIFGDKSINNYKKEFYWARAKKRRYYLLQSRVDYFTMKDAKSWPLFREGKFKGGLIVETLQKRKNPYGILALRTIGYSRMNAEDVGLEEYYNDYLCGRNGKILKQKIAGGVWMPIFTDNAIEPENGKDIYTTIDVNIQDVTEDALYDALKISKADFGCVVVMETKTGAIKAIANLGADKDSTYTEKYNYAIGLASEPGSTFKLATYLSLFNDGFINEKDTVKITNGSLSLYGKTIIDDHKVNGYYSAKDAFAMSSNTAIVRFALKYYKNDKKKFYKNLLKFGLDQKTNIDLNGEPSPTLSNIDVWSKLSLPWKAHGYENMFTPLQLLTFYNAVANDGYRVEPRLVDKILDNGRLIKNLSPRVSNMPIADIKAINSAKVLLEDVVRNEHGTAHKIYTNKYNIAGKTGTAKINIPKIGYQNKNQAMFCGYFPAESPAYSAIVVIYGPKGFANTGGAVAAPVFRRISDYIMATSPANQQVINIAEAKKYVPYAPVIADYPTLMHYAKLFSFTPQLPEHDGYILAKVNNNILQGKPISVNENIVPNVKGMTLDDAIYVLENIGLKVKFSGRGKVKEQSLSPGQKIAKGSIIQLSLG